MPMTKIVIYLQVIVQKAPHTNLLDLDKHKFLVPYDVTVAQFMWILRQRLTLSPNKAIYLFVNRTPSIKVREREKRRIY